ncbi:MAG: hypothetical protein GX610_20795 [Rhodococcus sp.]|nr:hypothetical protein [Rhodococcus sp. (in: high G+C Gram-positive bacteria)]
MFAAAALVPSPPLLVPELEGRGAQESADLRHAVRVVASELAARARTWIAVGVGPAADVVERPARGTFRGYGVDVEVAFGDPVDGEPHQRAVDPDLPLAALVAGWIRGSYAPDVELQVRILTSDTSPRDCAEYGRELRQTMNTADEPLGLLVVGDGASTLTDKAPGAYDPAAGPLQADLDRALAGGDVRTLRNLDPSEAKRLGVGGRVPWQVLAGVFDHDVPTCTTEYVAAPYGVGYHVGMWTP